MTTYTYTIPEVRREAVQKMVAAKQKKAERYGAHLSVTFGTPYAKRVEIRKVDMVTQTVYTERTATFEVFDLTIESEVIKADGFSVVAKIEHLEGGNVVTTYGGVEMRKTWTTIKPHCDHCGGNHGQRKTFIVRGQDGAERQVGSTCLKDYCGIDPQRIGWAESLGECLTEEYRDFDYIGAEIPRAYDTVKALAFACDLIRKQGYRKTSEANSNRDKIGDLLTDTKSWPVPTAEGRREAEQIAEGLKAMTLDEAFAAGLTEVKALVQSGYCKASHFGYIAYAPKAWAKHQEKVAREQARAEQRQTEARSSEYVGEVGQRLAIKVKSVDLLTSWDTQYGTTWLYKIVDHEDNVLMWFGSSLLGVDVDNGKSIQFHTVDSDSHYKATEIKATVKAHNERDGVRQTIVTRCKVTSYEVR